MPLSVNISGDTSEIRIDGEMDIYNAASLKDGLMDAVREARAVSLDLSGVSHLDTSGVQLVLLAWREAGAKGKPFRLAGASAQVEGVMGLYDLNGIFAAPGELA